VTVIVRFWVEFEMGELEGVGVTVNVGVELEKGVGVTVGIGVDVAAGVGVSVAAKVGIIVGLGVSVELVVGDGVDDGSGDGLDEVGVPIRL
jgi:hypothetical protein